MFVLRLRLMFVLMKKLYLLKNELANGSSTKAIKESVKCEPTEFVKIESLHIPNIIKSKTKPPEPKYVSCGNVFD